MLSSDDFNVAFQQLDLPASTPVIAHASLSAFGWVEGGAQALLEALLTCFETLVMPAFTYKTMLVPESGPPQNGITYGSRRDGNFMAQFFDPAMPVDRLIGTVAEALRRRPGASRSDHPILSFTGVNAAPYLEAQTLQEPLAPVQRLVEAQGWVFLLGVDHSVNTSIHYAERLAGRKQFIRWALTPQGIVACPGFPGCSDGFQAVDPHLAGSVRRLALGQAWLLAIPLVVLAETVRRLLRSDPRALLCEQAYCERCHAIREQFI